MLACTISSSVEVPSKVTIPDTDTAAPLLSFPEVLVATSVV
jgi:hypothetical protein